MSSFDNLMKARTDAHRNTETFCSSVKAADEHKKSVHILWLYPDILNIHGGRGDLMALIHAADLMEMPVEVRRCDDLKSAVDFEWADIIYMTSGELKCAPEIISALNAQRESLDAFLAKGGCLWAVASSGAALAEKLEFLDGTSVEGLGLLGMTWKERKSVWGDDLWFTVDEGIQVMGNQIQVADVFLNEDQPEFGQVIYGRGNCGDGRDGARKGNVVFTGCLGPVMVKNPRLAALLLETAATNAGVSEYKALEDKDIRMEDNSFELIRKFVENKMKK